MRDIPGGPVVEAQRFQCGGPGFRSCSRNQIPHATTEKKKKILRAASKGPTCYSEE